MAGELLAQVTIGDLFRETSVGYAVPFQSAQAGVMRGASFPKLIQAQLTEFYNASFIVPAAVALATGITVRLTLVDDGSNPADLGTNVVFGVTACNLSASGAKVDWSVGASVGTEATATVTLSSTSLNPVIASIAITDSHLASLAAGNVLGLRIRRLGDNASDTCQGRVVMLGGTITNT